MDVPAHLHKSAIGFSQPLYPGLVQLSNGGFRRSSVLTSTLQFGHLGAYPALQEFNFVVGLLGSLVAKVFIRPESIATGVDGADYQRDILPPTGSRRPLSSDE